VTVFYAESAHVNERLATLVENVGSTGTWWT